MANSKPLVSVDTNVVVRFLTLDDVAQAGKSRQVFRENIVWISKTVILETEWVLRGAYRLSKEVINDTLRALVEMEDVMIEDYEVVQHALYSHKRGWDFADALHLMARPAGVKLFFSFDKRLLKKKSSIDLRSP